MLQLGRKINEVVEWPNDLPFLTIGSSQGVAVGDRVATISSPEGLTNSVTDGLVSAVRRDENESLLQITAPISPGSSGGPVFDLGGKVVAITVAQFSEGQNLNFAIPIEVVAELRKQEYTIDFGDFRDAVAIQTRQSRTSLEGQSSDPRRINNPSQEVAERSQGFIVV